VSASPIPPLEFQQLQPVLLREGVAWVPGGDAAGAELVLPSGGRLPLRQFCPVATLADHSRRAQAPALLARAMAAVPQAAAPAQTVAAFLGVVVPGLEQWDAKGAVAPDPAGAAGAVAALPDVVRLLPEPALPEPSVLIFGRYWLLAPGEDAQRLRVVVEGQSLASTGQYRNVRDVSASWADVSLRQLTAECQRRKLAFPEDAPGLAEAQRAFREHGLLERGDLLLVAGTPALLGHVLPDRGRRLAIAAPLTFPVRVPPSGLAVLERHGAEWRYSARENGVCLGDAPDVTEWAQASSPAVGLALFLRFAAVRFAANGKFHERE
jgi:hypothetical protein